MADNTLIEWARHPVTGKGATWNIVTGCAVISPGCTNCYAMRLAGTRLRQIPSRQGLTVSTKRGPVWNGQTRFNADWLTLPLGWKQPRGIFVAAHGDLFADGVTDYQLDQIFAVMALTPRHIYFVLTKRPQRMREYVSGFDCDGARRLNVAAAAGRMMEDGDNAHDEVANAAWPLPNVWLGVSVEDQTHADERVPILLNTPAAIRFVSAEPLLGWIDLISINDAERPLAEINALSAYYRCGPSTFDAPGRLHWVIAGGESGPDARPSHPDWFRSLRDQCAAADVPFFFKQWGAWVHYLEVSSGFKNCSRFDRFGNVTEARARLHPPYKGGFVMPEGDVPWNGPMMKVGKKAAGRLLDGTEHSAFPEIRS